jgi:hypothetical protein
MAMVLSMKKLILSLTLMAFAVAVQADDAKASKDNSACCASKTQAKGTCPMANQAKASGACCKDAPGKQALLSPKAAGEASKKL